MHRADIKIEKEVVRLFSDMCSVFLSVYIDNYISVARYAKERMSIWGYNESRLKNQFQVAAAV